MIVEIEALQKSETWEIVSLPKKEKPAGFIWVYIVKYKAYGTIDKYKARLLAKGYTRCMLSIIKKLSIRLQR